MTEPASSAQTVLETIRKVADTLGHVPSRREFQRSSGMTEYQVLRHFPSWREALRAAGLESTPANLPLATEDLLRDWGMLVRRIRRIPTRNQYRREGKYSPGVFEKKFGPWSQIPAEFRRFAEANTGWNDVVKLLPAAQSGERPVARPTAAPATQRVTAAPLHETRAARLTDRQTYGNPIDFRGLRHEPVNEGGVVFLFGMIARELGYYVEAVQAAFPDCEAKRQIGRDRWQRVRIEFEFESRNFRDHGHAVDGCDVIVCWRHNWPECPSTLEVLELSKVIQTLSSSDD